MWLTRVEIHNFQKHERFEAVFTSKVNCIIGETDKGKSCLVRAIKWVLFNEPKGDVVRREGSGKTRVILSLDDGSSVEKVKSGKENAYIIRKGGAETRFDSFGKEIPPAVVKVLSAVPMVIENQNIILNVAGQLDSPFLLTESGGFRMKVLNKLIGSDILDLVSQDLNKDILRIGREEKVIADTLAKGKADLNEIEMTLLVKKRLMEKARPLYIKLKALSEKRHKTMATMSDIHNTQVEISGAERQIKAIVVPVGLPELVITAGRYKQVEVLLASIGNAYKEIVDVGGQLEKVVIPDGVNDLTARAVRHNGTVQVIQMIRDIEKKAQATAIQLGEVKVPEGLDSLKESASRYSKAIDIAKSLSEAWLNIGLTSDLIQKETDDIEQMRGKYKALLQEYGKCPVCHTPTTQEVLEKIEL